MKRDIHLERLLPFPPKTVWRALTDKHLLSKWLMENDLEPILGHRFTFCMKAQRGWDGMTHCEVIDLKPEETIAFSYRGEATGEKVLSCAGVESDRAKKAVKGIFSKLDTVLRFTLEPDVDCSGKERTRLILEHTGYRGLKLVLVSFVMGYGWKKSVLPRLIPVLEEIA